METAALLYVTHGGFMDAESDESTCTRRDDTSRRHKAHCFQNKQLCTALVGILMSCTMRSMPWRSNTACQEDKKVFFQEQACIPCVGD